MLVRLIIFTILFGFFIFFISFNINNRTDISLVFYTYKNVSVFFPVMISFFSGLLMGLFFMLFRYKK